jgi:hypothetical protein
LGIGINALPRFKPSDSGKKIVLWPLHRPFCGVQDQVARVASGLFSRGGGQLARVSVNICNKALFFQSSTKEEIESGRFGLSNCLVGAFVRGSVF